MGMVVRAKGEKEGVGKGARVEERGTDLLLADQEARKLAERKRQIVALCQRWDGVVNQHLTELAKVCWGNSAEFELDSGFRESVLKPTWPPLAERVWRVRLGSSYFRVSLPFFWYEGTEELVTEFFTVQFTRLVPVDVEGLREALTEALEEGALTFGPRRGLLL